MSTSASNSGSGRKISSPRCSPSNRWLWQGDGLPLATQNTTVESCMRFHRDCGIIHLFPPPIAPHKPPLHHRVRQRLPLSILVALWGTSTALLAVYLPSHTASAYHALVT